MRLAHSQGIVNGRIVAEREIREIAKQLVKQSIKQPGKSAQQFTRSDQKYDFILIFKVMHIGTSNSNSPHQF
jgi:hypothetical protein